MTVTTHEVLVAMRNIVVREGWEQRHYGMCGAPKCLVGSLFAAGGARDLEWDCMPAGGRKDYLASQPVVAEALEVLDRLAPREVEYCDDYLPEKWGHAEAFSEAHGTTQGDILALVDCAIGATAPTPDLSFLREAVSA